MNNLFQFYTCLTYTCPVLPRRRRMFRDTDIVPGGMASVRKQATPLPISVRHSGHLLPILSKNKMLIATAGTSTMPASQETALKLCSSALRSLSRPVTPYFVLKAIDQFYVSTSLCKAYFSTLFDKRAGKSVCKER